MEAELTGEIKKIIYRNEFTNYTVLEISSDEGDRHTVVGCFPPISEGQMVRVSGKFERKSSYGLQFTASKIFVYQPSRLLGIKRFLGSKLIKGLGPVTAEAIVDKYGIQTLEKMKYPIEIAKVKGISLKKATDFCLQFAQINGMQESMIFLQEIGMTINLAMKIYRVYGDKTKQIITQNPYQLVYDINGVGFFTADVIAEKLGVERDSDFRIRAAITYALREASTKKGHNYLPENELVKDVMEILSADSDEISQKITDNIDDMELFGDIIRYKTLMHTAVLLKTNYLTEKNIARKLLQMKSQAAMYRVNVDDEIKNFEKEAGFTLHPNQVAAVKSSVENGINIITGGPGTGKTTIVKCILKLFKDLDQKVALCAPTGRAAKRLSQSTEHEAKTIHRLLGIDWKEGDHTFIYNESNLLEYDVIIVDEVSMVDESLFNSLLSALDRGTRLILVGDKDQLPSVGAGNVLNDLIASGKFDVSYLTQIYRQSEDSMIVPNAHKINAGYMPDLDNHSSDFFYEQKNTGEDILKTTLSLVTERLPKFKKVKPIDIQVLSPMKRGNAGTKILNQELQKAINPHSKTKNEIRFGDTIFREGDKVMQMANNYQLEWHQESDGKMERGLGVFNGDIGIIKEINNISYTIEVEFDDGRCARYSNGDYEQLALAYAVTIHKSQGSEFDNVVIALDANYLLQTRNLLYTAVTRAKKTVVLVGAKKTIWRMIQNNETTKRNSLLMELLEEESQKGFDI